MEFGLDKFDLVELVEINMDRVIVVDQPSLMHVVAVAVAVVVVVVVVAAAADKQMKDRH